MDEKTIPQPVIKRFGPKPKPMAERFWEKVEQRGPDECWPWLAAVDEDGYGRFRVGGIGSRTLNAQRVAFFLKHGRLPTNNGCHSCDNPPCCNPDHVFDGTHADNVADRVQKGRSFRGPRQSAIGS